MKLVVTVVTLLGLIATPRVFVAVPPPRGLKVIDRPNDQGGGLLVDWDAPATSFNGRYELFLKDLNLNQKDDAAAIPKFKSLARVPADVTNYEIEDLKPGHDYLVKLVAIGPDGNASEPVTIPEPISPRANWFNTTRGWLLIALVIISGAVLAYLAAARRGVKLWMRPIAGLQAVTDAVGRAVEMGKKVLFVPGIQDINDIQTVAGVTILSRVSRIGAEYDAEFMIPTARSLVMVTCRETVEASFLQAGRPDSYNPDDIYYLTDQQFGFAAGTTGAMVREKPAACIYMGAFFAESLLLAETGNSIGAIQVAGTAMPSQLPFFIAACDYTLIGEEFFAASAYLSGEPQQLGSLKGQDFGKLLGTLLILIGCLLAPIGYVVGDSPVVPSLPAAAGADAAEPVAWNTEFVEFLTENILGGGTFLPEIVAAEEGP